MQAARLAASDPGFPAREAVRAMQARPRAASPRGHGRRPSAASYCPESDAYEVAAGRGQTYWVGTNGIQKELGERD